MRTYRPAIVVCDGTDEFELSCPDFRPVTSFQVVESRRHDKAILARRDGAVSYLEGKLDVIQIRMTGSFGKSEDIEGNEANRDWFIGEIMRKDRTFKLFRYSDRYCLARLTRASWPMGRQIGDYEQEYQLDFDVYDPYWYDTSGAQTVAFPALILNSDVAVVPIAGNAPTPLQIQIDLPAIMPLDCSTLWAVRWDDLNGALDDDKACNWNKHYFRVGDTICFFTGGESIYWDSADGNRTILVTPDSSCASPLESVLGYFFHSGPGDTTMTFTTPLNLTCDASASITISWTNRYYNP